MGGKGCRVQGVGRRVQCEGCRACLGLPGIGHPRKALRGGISKVNLQQGCQLLTTIPHKWLQERGNGSKNEDGLPPRRAFCGGMIYDRLRVGWSGAPTWREDALCCYRLKVVYHRVCSSIRRLSPYFFIIYSFY